MRLYVASRTCLLAGRGGPRMSAVDAPELDDAVQQIYQPKPTSSAPVSRARLIVGGEHPARGEGECKARSCKARSARRNASGGHRVVPLRRPSTEHRDSRQRTRGVSATWIQIFNEVEAPGRVRRPHEIAFYRLCTQPCGGPAENPASGSVELLIGRCRGIINLPDVVAGSDLLPWLHEAAPSDGGHHEQPPECCGH
jgi:hypothetical protein